MVATAPLPDGLRAKLDFVKLIVRDIAVAEDFYRRALGLVVAQRIDMDELEEAILRRGPDDRGPSLVLYRHKDGRTLEAGSLHGPIGFYVSDVDALFAHAVAEGATPLRPPFTTGASRVAFIADPDGHEIELIRFGG